MDLFFSDTPFVRELFGLALLLYPIVGFTRLVRAGDSGRAIAGLLAILGEFICNWYAFRIAALHDGNAPTLVAIGGVILFLFTCITLGRAPRALSHQRDRLRNTQRDWRRMSDSERQARSWGVIFLCAFLFIFIATFDQPLSEALPARLIAVCCGHAAVVSGLLTGFLAFNETLPS